MQENEACIILSQKQKKLLMRVILTYINLYTDYIKHTKVSWKRFGLDYWFSAQLHY